MKTPFQTEIEDGLFNLAYSFPLSKEVDNYEKIQIELERSKGLARERLESDIDWCVDMIHTRVKSFILNDIN